jgi:hypothetical protein
MKIRIVLEGLRGEESIASLCRREGIVANLYYRWSKEFLEAGKKRLLPGPAARIGTYCCEREVMGLPPADTDHPAISDVKIADVGLKLISAQADAVRPYGSRGQRRHQGC